MVLKNYEQQHNYVFKLCTTHSIKKNQIQIWNRTFPLCFNVTIQLSPLQPMTSSLQLMMSQLQL